MESDNQEDFHADFMLMGENADGSVKLNTSGS